MTPQLTIINETSLVIPLTRDLALAALRAVIEGEGHDYSFVEVVYVNEEGITEINRKYLNHDYVTDIITFGYNETDQKGPIEATLFCCAPRITEQAEELGVDVKSEFLRVFIHGLLHLTGYEDRSDEEKTIMRERESTYINTIA